MGGEQSVEQTQEFLIDRCTSVTSNVINSTTSSTDQAITVDVAIRNVTVIPGPVGFCPAGSMPSSGGMLRGKTSP